MLSIDVAFGAMICAMWFARVFNAGVESQTIICLGLTVWIIYTADHLIDVRLLKNPASTDRHRFHQRNFKNLFALLVSAAIADVILVFFVSTDIQIRGFFLGAVIFVYFLIQSRLRLLKEPAGALLYCLGIFLPSFPDSVQSITLFMVLISIHFLISVLINLILFSWFDHQRDLQDNRSSMVTSLGFLKGKTILVGLFVVQVMLFFAACFSAASPYSLLVPFLMTLSHLFIFVESRYFSQHDRYRYAGDAIFLLPVIRLMLP